MPSLHTYKLQVFLLSHNIGLITWTLLRATSNQYKILWIWETFCISFQLNNIDRFKKKKKTLYRLSLRRRQFEPFAEFIRPDFLCQMHYLVWSLSGKICSRGKASSGIDHNVAVNIFHNVPHREIYFANTDSTPETDSTGLPYRTIPQLLRSQHCWLSVEVFFASCSANKE